MYVLYKQYLNLNNNYLQFNYNKKLYIKRLYTKTKLCLVTRKNYIVNNTNLQLRDNGHIIINIKLLIIASNI